MDNPYRYSTKEWDEKSGLYYFGARYYSPEIGRWTQRDPAGTVEGLNLYSYVKNEPCRRLDPWGLVSASDIMEVAKETCILGMEFSVFLFGWYNLTPAPYREIYEKPLKASVAATLTACGTYLALAICIGDKGEQEAAEAKIGELKRMLERLGLGTGGQTGGGQPPKPKPKPVGPVWKPPSRPIWEWFWPQPVFY